MILMLHIIIALGSLVFTSVVAVKPSYAKLRIAYGMAGATFATGTYLLIMTPSHLVQACIMGLLYFAIMSYVIALARNKLASADY